MQIKLIAENLSKQYQGQFVVNSFNIEISQGQVIGLLGPNGAGKSTIVGMLYGSIIPNGGSVKLFDGQNLHTNFKKFLGVVSQEDNLDPDFDTYTNLIVFARYYGLIGPKARQKASELLQLVNLNERAKAQIDELSGGMKRRLVLARALIGSPQILFLDEPTTGLDPDARQEFWKLIAFLKEQGKGVLLTTHYMDEAERLCDRIILLQKGQQIDEGSPKELIRRVIGQKVIEVVGPTEQEMQKLAFNYYKFADGFIIIKPQDNQLEAHLEDLRNKVSKFLERNANLEDVFLKLTGESL